ncbi:MAG: hypothetical protein QM754_14265 [Tepidisphaeraceae bacterium]
MSEQLPPADAAPPAVLIYVRDLMFSSKVVATARAEGTSFRAVRDRSKLLTLPAGLLIVDLNAPENLEAAVEWKRLFGKPVIGFAGHVFVDTLNAAKAAGIDHVMTNGGFSHSLPEIMSRQKWRKNAKTVFIHQILTNYPTPRSEVPRRPGNLRESSSNPGLRRTSDRGVGGHLLGCRRGANPLRAYRERGPERR